MILTWQNRPSTQTRSAKASRDKFAELENGKQIWRAEIMSPVFGISEVLEFAIQIEKNGQFYYKKFTEKFKTDKRIKDIFEFLASEEVKHQKTFEEMLSKLEDYQPPESYPGEYFAYVKSYANEHVFTDKSMQEERLRAINTIDAALNLGITAEQDSILYYTEMKKLIPTYSQKDLEKIIEEEQTHFIRLMKLKQSLH